MVHITRKIWIVHQEKWRNWVENARWGGQMELSHVAIILQRIYILFLSLPRMCEQGSKQTLSPSFTGKEQEVRNTVTTERQLEYRNTLLDQIFKSKFSFLNVGGYFWPTARCSSEQRGKKKKGIYGKSITSVLSETPNPVKLFWIRREEKYGTLVKMPGRLFYLLPLK